MEQINLKNIKIKLLNENHDLNDFDCGNEDLNEFLKKDSLFQKNIMLNTAYLAFYNGKIVGFLTISSDSLNLKKLGNKYKERFQDKEVGYKTFPTIKLGRFAVDKNFQDGGIGRVLIMWLINFAIQNSEKIGFRFINIDAYIIAFNFYKKYYFKPFPVDLEKIFRKYEKAKARDLKTANSMTLGMFLDLHSL
ncbi:GNAT family N-acetyltransferase [Methanobrevibacter curvatus]|uniref:N-acetyltransferase domain-containing protein n=1 Tax=Methanobrevibacter curvatus TaxID=49547 RepID=A0A166APZ2_9EURY|nr:GNAT family N-acetyltransferase [Methanobrevibacter curvatus]KZX12322.1 hypothetical protein MBCUR_10790 [Methanobrevibacter curvatus]